MKKLVLFFFALLIFASLSFSAIPSGYMGLNWGSSFDTVNSKFINLTVYEKKISDLTSYVSYLQFSPTPNIDKRIFYFFEGGLAAVKIIYIFGINQLNNLKAISRALLKDLGQSRVKNYQDQRYGRVVEHITWNSPVTCVNWFLAQAGTEVAVTGQTNYLYFESQKYKRIITKAISEHRAGARHREQTQTRVNRGY